jgi:glycosyltransferase involved in cell wall biosynthesis
MISVLIPVYNTNSDFLRQCLDSCLHQTIENYEIVIVDNGSTNKETLDVLSQYSKEDKIKLLNCPRKEGKKNLSVALNYGLQRCKFELVARMDSDDLMFHDRLEKQLNFFHSNRDVDILGGQIDILPMRNKTKHKEDVTINDALNSYWFINHPTVMFRKSKILSIGGYKETPELFAEDYELWLRALGEGLKIKNLKECVVFYRSHDNNLTRQTEKNPNYYSIMNKSRDNLRKKINGSS